MPKGVRPNPTDTREIKVGSHNYRAYIGPPERYDTIAAMQFNLLTSLGLREGHYLADIGCGSLRAGRLFIPYLLPGHYYGIEPNNWLIGEGIQNELGESILTLKSPTFSASADFDLSAFGQNFDFILAQSIFSHATLAQVKVCLEQVARTLSPDGIFAASYFKGDVDYDGDEWVYPDCVYFKAETMAAEAAKLGLRYVSLDFPHPNGMDWAAFVHTSRETPRLNIISDLRDKVAELEERATRPWGKRIKMRLARLLKG